MKLIALSLSLLLPILAAASAFAGSRRFTYVYEVTTSPPGDVEVENWITWKTRRPDDRGFDQVEFRHELEFGITDKFQAAIYIADWNYHRGLSTGERGLTLSGSALELIYDLTNPVADSVGLAVYQEFQGGYRRFESETKLLAQKNFGKFVAAYNATLEAEWEGEGLEERQGEFQQSLGLSYEVSPRLLFGAEFVHEVAFPDWSNTERGKFFAGPNISIRHRTNWVTVTALAQITRAGDEPDFQLRTVFGFSF
ncbi:MAG: hypothetical protein DME97_04200 [Verrucomicrobia bacterium]|nr:MAG: hypothetical protein DME97_04200 [Verrucomicrobiota bacterium]